MGIFDHILIVSDIDGTFVDGNKQIVERNITALRTFIREGGRFTFATGRMHGTVLRTMPIAREITNVPGIMSNGAYLYDLSAGEVVEANYLDATLVLDALRLCVSEYPEIGIRVSTSGGFLTPRMEGLIYDDLHMVSEKVTVASVDEFPTAEWYKVVFRAEPECLDAFRAEVEKRWPERFNIVKSQPTFLEFQDYHCSKAAMLARLKARCTVEGKAPVIYAVGDYENDYQMLQAADVAVCPTNALPMIREIADLSPATNDEGVIGALIEVLESELKK